MRDGPECPVRRDDWRRFHPRVGAAAAERLGREAPRLATASAARCRRNRESQKRIPRGRRGSASVVPPAWRDECEAGDCGWRNAPRPGGRWTRRPPRTPVRDVDATHAREPKDSVAEAARTRICCSGKPRRGGHGECGRQTTRRSTAPRPCRSLLTHLSHVPYFSGHAVRHSYRRLAHMQQRSRPRPHRARGPGSEARGTEASETAMGVPGAARCACRADGHTRPLR